MPVQNFNPSSLGCREPWNHRAVRGLKWVGTRSNICWIEGDRQFWCWEWERNWERQRHMDKCKKGALSQTMWTIYIKKKKNWKLESLKPQLGCSLILYSNEGKFWYSHLEFRTASPLMKRIWKLSGAQLLGGYNPSLPLKVQIAKFYFELNVKNIQPYE